jgi:tetratricopeptide (TPR) repeat protein
VIRNLLTGSLLVLILNAPAGAVAPDVPKYEPSELMRRADWLDRSVVVDDRVSRFQWHRDRGIDEIYLSRTPVIFRLPPRLRYERSPQAAAVHIEGVLKREGELWFCDVNAIDLFPPDLKRLEQAVKTLDRRDAEGRMDWARWAEYRAKAFKDQELLDQSRLLESEALRIEADRTAVDPPRRWLELARRARARQLPEPEPSALAHRGFVPRLAAAESVADLQTLVREIEDFWPKSPVPPAGEGETDLNSVLARYADDPAGAYREASQPVRAALDHRLWADATQRLVERRMAAEPARALELAEGAAVSLPDRPQVVRCLREQGLLEATRDLGTLRRADVEARARTYRETLQQPEAGRDLLRRWLEDQRRHRLSATDAEGRLILADQYEALLGDRETAIELLRDAWRIDPQSKEVADAFRRRAFRKVKDQWVESPHANSRLNADTDPDPGPSPNPPALPRSSTLRGLTPSEVRQRLGGKPDRIVRSATRGQLVEQWIYQGANQDQYLNFLHSPGDPLPKVVAYFARPRTRWDHTRHR